MPPLLLLLAVRLPAQLPMITIPHGALEIGLIGAFYPNDQVWDNGTRRPLESLVDPDNPLTADLQARLSQALAIPVTGLSLGATTVAAREHGIGDINFGYGVTRRLTLFVTFPVVYVRSRVAARADSIRGRVGLNPANAVAQNSIGQQQTGTFFTQFDAALATLTQNIQQGVYAGDASVQAAAQQALANGTDLRASLYALLGDPQHSSVLLPLANDVYGATLDANITTIQSTLRNQLNVPGFSALPALPTIPIVSVDEEALDTTSNGYGFASPNEKPKYGLGDIEAGLAYRLIAHDSAGAPRWNDVWLRATARFPTGTAPDSSVLLDQGTGSKSPAARLDAIAEVGRGRTGVRAEVSYQHAFPGNVVARLSEPDQLLVSPANIAAVRTQPGDSLTITLRPFIRFAPHLALAGVAQYWRRSSSETTYIAGQLPIAGLDASIFDVGSAANALIVGLGVSYSHPGGDGLGGNGLPVEAAWSIERTIHSSSGVFPDALTTRVSLRFYRPIVRH
jgi:hypothetical protein